MVDALDAGFDTAVILLVQKNKIIYGFDQSVHHVQIEYEPDTDTVFGSLEAEHAFRALVADTIWKSPELEFKWFAHRFIEHFGYSQDISFSLGIAHALIVGRAEHFRIHGHDPVNTRAFVVAYMADQEAVTTPF